MIKITRVWERLFVGGRIDAERLYRTNSFDITTVVCCCEDQVIRRAPGINYLHFSVQDSTSVERSRLDEIIDAIAENIRWGTILLHCESGLSLAPVFAAAWMHVVGFKNIEGALKEIASLRPISPSTLLVSSVRGYLE